MQLLVDYSENLRVHEGQVSICSVPHDQGPGLGICHTICCSWNILCSYIRQCPTSTGLWLTLSAGGNCAPHVVDTCSCLIVPCIARCTGTLAS